MVVPTKRMINLQRSREAEITNTINMTRERDQRSFSRPMIQLRLDDIKATWDEIRQTNAEIIGRDDTDALRYEEENTLPRLQRIYENARDELVVLMNSLPDVSSSVASSQITGNEIGQLDNKSAKLPKLDLPSFSGKYEDWESFSDLFVSLVHTRSKLSDATKLQYLKSCLTGSAAEFIKGVTITDANYQVTWQALKARYCNPRLIVRNYLFELSSLPSVKKESAEGLRSLLDNAQRIIRGLGSVGMPITQWDVWLVHVVSNLMDSESQKL
ncbi:uncharacterized protein [Prorops nasuta]|uniref:uncharacterized protein n=1 Tax=Prorops nasuta TaxID=863751 RepID=UPI0034D018F9